MRHFDVHPVPDYGSEDHCLSLSHPPAIVGASFLLIPDRYLLGLFSFHSDQEPWYLFLRFGGYRFGACLWGGNYGDEEVVESVQASRIHHACKSRLSKWARHSTLERGGRPYH